MIVALWFRATGFSSSDFELVTMLALAIVGVFFIASMNGKFDRERIRENIEASGGRVINIERRRLGGVGAKYMRTFDVTYTTRHGKRVEASCITSMARGVAWVSNHPPGISVEDFEERGPAEPIECLECGAKIPSGEMRCPHCGWSYKTTVDQG
jgi:hypothetical protein